MSVSLMRCASARSGGGIFAINQHGGRRRWPPKLFVPGERTDGLKYGGAHATLHPPKACSQLQIAAQNSLGEP